MTVSAVTSAPFGPTGSGPGRDGDAEIRAAARQFEGLLLEQLISTMRRSAELFSGSGGELYGRMFDEHLGAALASSGGLGVGDALAVAMGATGPVTAAAPSTPFVPRLSPSLMGPVLEERPSSGAELVGATGRLQRAAGEMLPPSGVAPQWGRDGALTAGDLIDPRAEAGAASEVQRVRAFRGYYKCNLFAFELARRAGFEVPTYGRGASWGYPGPTAVAEDASDGRLRTGWGEVVSHASVEALDSAIVRGEVALLVTGSGAEGHSGHMGIIERVRSIDRDASGAITRITFDGWEGREVGGMHLTERTWTTLGHGVPGARRGLGRIELVELRAAEPHP